MQIEIKEEKKKTFSTEMPSFVVKERIGLFCVELKNGLCVSLSTVSPRVSHKLYLFFLIISNQDLNLISQKKKERKKERNIRNRVKIYIIN